MEEDLNIDMNTPIGSYLDPIREMTGEQLKQQDEEEEAAEEAKAAEPQGLGLVVSETGAAIRGGGAQAVESVGGFAELAGDTFKTGFNSLFGRPIDNTQNPFSSEYVEGDAGWLDLPDDWAPENKTALGKVGRSLVEFGLLSIGTGGVGGLARGVGVGAKAANAWKQYSAGNRLLQFVGKSAKVASEGAAADLISSSSEEENLSNLIQDVPWLSNSLSNALAIDEEDNPWVARIKTTTEGMGLAHIGWAVAGFIRGRFKAKKALKEGKTPEQANAEGNAEYKKTVEEGQANQNKAADERREAAIKDGETTTPDVQPQLYDDVDKAVVQSGGFAAHVKDLMQNMKLGDGEAKSYIPLFTESALKAIARGDKNIQEYLDEAINSMADDVFKEAGNTFSFEQIKMMTLATAADLSEIIDAGGDIAANFAKYFEEGADANARVYINAGNRIITASPAQKAALQLTINSLAKQVQAISAGTFQLAEEGLSIRKQGEIVFDAMTVALKEHKKIGYFWGLDGRYQQVNLMPKDLRDATQKRLAEIDVEADEFNGELKRLLEKGDQKSIKALMEMNALSGGRVRVMAQIKEFLTARLRGGEMDGITIRGEARTQTASMFYNSILSSLKTPIKAITGTNLIALIRPLQAYVGATYAQGLKKLAGKSDGFSEREMLLAAVQIDGYGQALAEGWRMFKYAWDQGLNRKNLPYDGRFDVQAEMDEWESLAPFYKEYGSTAQQKAYGFLDTIVKFNTNPLVKYSQNAMGAGDALARTVVGRMQMRQNAAIAALDQGIDPKDVKAFVRKYEENFRDEIFKKNRDGQFIVTDKAAKMAGDEAAMTTALQGNMKGWELIGKLPMMNAFFPFVRTGFNALNLTFQHTPLAVFHKKYKDLMYVDPKTGAIGRNLEEYGLTPKTVAQERALMEGRIAMGSTIMGMATIAAMSGNLTGDFPYNKEDRAAWEAAGKKPYSYKFEVGGKTIYMGYNDLEPFNTLFAMVANVVQNANTLGEKTVENWMQKLVFMTSAVIVDKSMLAGVEDLASLMNQDTAEQRIKLTGAKFIRSHLPYAGLMGQIGDLTDANRKEATSLLQMIIKRDAVFKSFLPNQHDILSKDRSGQPLSTAAEAPLFRLFNSVSPIPITDITNDPVKQGLVEMRYNMPEILSKIDGVPLNAYEKSELSRLMSMGDLRARLERVMIRDPYWRKAFDEYKKANISISEGADLFKMKFYQLVDEEFKKAKQIAVAKLKRENPELYDRIETRRTTQKLSQTGQLHRIKELLDMPK
jgi:hypothetical protein